MSELRVDECLNLVLTLNELWTRGRNISTNFMLVNKAASLVFLPELKPIMTSSTSNYWLVFQMLFARSLSYVKLLPSFILLHVIFIFLPLIGNNPLTYIRFLSKKQFYTFLTWHARWLSKAWTRLILTQSENAVILVTSVYIRKQVQVHGYVPLSGLQLITTNPPRLLKRLTPGNSLLFEVRSCGLQLQNKRKNT